MSLLKIEISERVKLITILLILSNLLSSGVYKKRFTAERRYFFCQSHFSVNLISFFSLAILSKFELPIFIFNKILSKNTINV